MTYANEAMAQMMGFRSADLPGKHLLDLVYPGDAPLAQSLIQRAAEGATRAIDCRWRTTYDGEIWTRCNSIPLTGEDGQSAGSVAILENITEKRSIEETRALLASIVESSDDVIVSKDLNGVVRSWNRGAERVFGYTAQEMIGQPIYKIIPKERWAEEDETLARMRQGQRIDHFQTVRVAKDGRKVAISLTVSPIKDSSGAVVGVSKVARDITEQIILDQARARLAAIVESSDDAIVSKNLDGIIQTWNKGAEQIFGYSAEEIVGKQIHRLLPDDRQGEENLILDRLRKGYRIDHYETVRKRKDGRLIDVSVTISPIRNSSGVVIGASKVARDVTEKKRAEDALRQSEESLRALTEQLEERVRERTKELEDANKEMEGFTYSVSHDLRSPLRAIVSTSMVTMEDYGHLLPEEAKEQLARQAAAAQRMAILIDELLHLSRLSRADLRCTRVDVTKMAHELAGELCNSEDGCKVEFAIQPNLTAMGDARLLRLALQNLMDNARKFSPEGGVVSVGATELDGETVFYVKDHGIGFDMRFAHKLFLPFERLVTDAEFPGTGIGLANVKRIIDRHGGTIWPESTPGKGATFFFKLPGEQNAPFLS